MRASARVSGATKYRMAGIARPEHLITKSTRRNHGAAAFLDELLEVIPASLQPSDRPLLRVSLLGFEPKKFRFQSYATIKPPLTHSFSNPP